MPREVTPRADRETQKSEFYFTDHSLTGQSSSLSTAGLLLHLRQTFFHRSHFDWHGSFPFQELDACRRPAGRRVGLSVGAGVHSQDARHLYFTDRTLTGNESPFAFGAGSQQRGESSLAAPSPNLFHRMHFDWCARHLALAPNIPHVGGQAPRTERTNFFSPIAF